MYIAGNSHEISVSLRGSQWTLVSSRTGQPEIELVSGRRIRAKADLLPQPTFYVHYE